MFALDDVESADAGADVDADHLGVFRGDFQLRHFNGFVGGGDGEVNEAAHLLHIFFFDEVEGIEVEDLGCDLASEGGSVEPSDATDAALAGDDGLPDCIGGAPKGADEADAGNDDASFWMARQINLRIP